MIQRLPLDVQLLIIQYLGVEGILNLRATCQLFHRIGQTRSIYQYAINAILDGTNPTLSSSLDSLSAQQLRIVAIKVARLDAFWATQDLRPVIKYQMPCEEDVAFAKLLPGGDWVAFVRDDGEIYLRRLEGGVEGEGPRIGGGNGRLSHLTFDLFPSTFCDCLLLLTGEDDVNRNNHLFLYGVRIGRNDEMTCQLERLVVLAMRESIVAATVGADIVVFACSIGEDEFVVARTFGEDVARQVVISVDCTEAFVDCTFCVLGDHQLLVCSSDGFFIFDIPPLQPLQPPSPFFVVAVSASWTLSCQITIYPPVVSPIVIHAYERAIMVLDQHHIHILFPSTSPSFRTIPLPIRNDADITSVGSRRAIWWNALDTPMEGFRGFRIRTCAFPVVFGDDDLEQASLSVLGVKIGGLLVHMVPIARRDPTLDLIPLLQRSGPSVVKTRTGSVLSRGFILKTDHYPSGRALDLDLNVHGAPNFRAPRLGGLNIFGAAQPRTQGLRAILSILRARPNTPNPTHVVWFSTREEPIIYISGRPFVLRDASEPRRTLKISDRAENLEGIEQRLKTDILQEAARNGGLVLTHNEVAADSGEGAILPTWTAVDSANVKTSKELWGQYKEEGWNVEYHRIPISPERPIEDNYLDAYLRVIKNTDPLATALVFSCGMGAVRTTFAMVAASLVRRKQIIKSGMEDPYAKRVIGLGMVPGGGLPLGGANGHASGVTTPTRSPAGSPAPESMIAHALEQASVQQDMNRSLLRLTYVIQQNLHNRDSQSAIELLLGQPTLLENLRKGHMGNYGVILSLLGCLDDGLATKKLVDRVIDSCEHSAHHLAFDESEHGVEWKGDQVTNLRESILTHRVKYSLTSTMDETTREDFLTKAVRSLEKYFFVIAFASYVESQDDFQETFSDWLRARTEIWNQVMFLRKIHGSRLNIFAPVNDLSSLSKTGAESQIMLPGQQNDVAISGGQLLGDEYSDHVVRNRSGIILREGTLLKSDQWLSESQHVEHGVRGAINFRNIPGTNIYALGQPTVEAIDEVVERVRSAHPEADRIMWITLREEPIVYVNGAPYCLRRERFSLRNMKDYGGISASRLEVLEERLRDDVVAEVGAFGGRLLLHSETSDGSVIPIWEEVRMDDVSDMKDVMSSCRARHSHSGLEVHYARIPITAERPPDFSDLSELIDLVVRTDSTNTPIVLNCQLGRGRSTMTSIILLLIQRWLENGRSRKHGPRMFMNRSMSTKSIGPEDGIDSRHTRRSSYTVINNLLRVIRKGPAVKGAVDDAIDQCDEVLNLRDSIDDCRTRAEQATDDRQRRVLVQKGLHNLRRYFELVIFQAYLQSIEPDTMESFETFESFVQNRPVIKTFEKDFNIDESKILKLLQRADVLEGVAFPDEVMQVVTNRTGTILSASTILKSDFFSNLQKMTLPERIDGSPNFRRVPLVLGLVSSSHSQGADFAPVTGTGAKMVCGRCGMPTVQGLRRALSRVGAGPEDHNMVFWTSLREEPVIYVQGRPHVLRLVDRPLENVEATGVTTAMVEAMEARFKKDVVKEVRAGDGRILLHDEVEERPGVFSLVPIWETVSESDIMTPRDVFNLMAQEGYHINYDRVAITDEQAPLPDALDQLYNRVKEGLSQAGDFIFNCQMGRGRTTTGMVTACLIATTTSWTNQANGNSDEEVGSEGYDSIDGPSEEEAYLQGEYKTILQLVGVLSHGKVAKRLTDHAIDLMQDVQNLRKAVYDYKLKVDASEKGSAKQHKLLNLGINYLYRYGALIAFANYLIERREGSDQESPTFPSTSWSESSFVTLSAQLHTPEMFSSPYLGGPIEIKEVRQEAAGMYPNHLISRSHYPRNLWPQNLSGGDVPLHGHPSIGRPTPFTHGQFTGQCIRAELHEIQQPELGRKYAVKDRRPLEPPPVVQAKLFRVLHAETPHQFEEEIVNLDDVVESGLICHVDLFPVPSLSGAPTTTGSPVSGIVASSGDHKIKEADKCTSVLAGETFVHAARLDYKGANVLFFVFPDISVRSEGIFVLRYRFFDITSPISAGTHPILGECYGGTFRVYSTKDFPGLPPSTDLTKVNFLLALFSLVLILLSPPWFVAFISKYFKSNSQHISRYGIRLNVRERKRIRRKKPNSTRTSTITVAAYPVDGQNMNLMEYGRDDMGDYDSDSEGE
ncbi:hypothetical protein JAAARDRAFT_194263 [Jaapia argillacea MUCL 33604]|uniref:F-box domain-containing protein n=1 Tax=Jaapia argillacea MUCL 33604 TaxID=933084 RepID=A0A067PQI6_9AGAM|nr:hypothetical protein JAAARDRAFT_194263 [Jaapia argillacea MUCL 33604]